MLICDPAGSPPLDSFQCIAVFDKMRIQYNDSIFHAWPDKFIVSQTLQLLRNAFEIPFDKSKILACLHTDYRLQWYGTDHWIESHQDTSHFQLIWAWHRRVHRSVAGDKMSIYWLTKRDNSMGWTAYFWVCSPLFQFVVDNAVVDCLIHSEDIHDWSVELS